MAVMEEEIALGKASVRILICRLGELEKMAKMEEKATREELGEEEEETCSDGDGINGGDDNDIKGGGVSTQTDKGIPLGGRGTRRESQEAEEAHSTATPEEPSPATEKSKTSNRISAETVSSTTATTTREMAGLTAAANTAKSSAEPPATTPSVTNTTARTTEATITVSTAPPRGKEAE